MVVCKIIRIFVVKLKNNIMENLKELYKKETGENWENSQGEPDIDYVAWLSYKITNAVNVIDHLIQGVAPRSVEMTDRGARVGAKSIPSDLAIYDAIELLKIYGKNTTFKL